ncbi:MAG: magnesium and cobalt exporter, family [Chthoniobacter sp.]|jgi:CBS domain containing-hemolysin-like protein|nr:magnesium and cobalt exporter, family [Chthoniobacter sp.]
MSAWLLVAVVLFLAAISALFSAIETALFSMQPLQVRRLHRRNPALARALERLMESPRRLLSAILLGDALVNLPLIVLSLFLIREAAPRAVPFWLASLVIFALIVLVCDLGPKVLALNQPYRVTKVGVRIMSAAMPLFDPLARVLQSVSEKFAHAITPEKLQPHHHLSEDELETLVQLSAEEGALEETESEMIQEIIKLGDKTVKDCMTPRVDVFALPDDLTNEEAISQLKTKRHRRVLVFADTPDNVLGIIDVKNFLLDPAEHYTETMIPPSFVPETMKALDLLRSFLRHPQGLAVIVDEFGGTEGIITLNDIIEEIISDAVPAADRELYIEAAGEGRVIASGRTRLDDLDELGFHFEAEGVDTIGGLVFNRLGYVPKAGTDLRIDDVRISIRRSARKGVEEMLLARDEQVAEVEI